MGGIMTRKPGLHKLLIVVRRDGADNDGSAFVSASLSAETAARFGPRAETPLSILACDGEILVGGLNGVTHWRWCYIRQFWVEQSWRGRGVGQWLLAQAEAEARARDCIGLYLDTFDAGAATFYERQGFARFGQINDFPPGFARTFLFKRLPSPE
jgi:GNAT superfamily N-acetyltransferase